MLLAYSNQVYLTCGVLLMKSENLMNELNVSKSKYEYIDINHIIQYKSRILLFFKINYCNTEHFLKSIDYEFLKDKLNIIQNFSFEGKDSLEDKLYKHKDSINLLGFPRNKNKQIPNCYYCGYITGNRENLMYKLFQKKFIKAGAWKQIAIYGIDYITDHIDNCFFKVSKAESIPQLIGNDDYPIKKFPFSLKNKLYPYLLVNTLEGISVYKVDSIDKQTKLGGNTFGVATLWSLIQLSTGYTDPEEAVRDATKGRNTCDLTVGEIYGGSYDQFGLNSNYIASSFGKVKYKDRNSIKKEDIARSLITLFATQAAQIMTFLSATYNTGKAIILGNPFNNLKFMQYLNMFTSSFSENKVESLFSDYSQYVEIIGMCVLLDKEKKLGIEYDDEYLDII